MASSISIDGMLNDIQHLGFTRGDAEREGIDNALDAGAFTVRINRDTAKKVVSIADNGSGMDDAGCTKSLVFFDSVAASNKVGRFGLGNKALHICLSAGATQTTILSKKEGLLRVQVKADWPKARSTGVWNPAAGEIGAETGIPIWNDLSINQNHGTVMYIPMPAAAFAEHQANLDSDLAELGFSYEEELKTKRIELAVNGVVQPLDMSLALGWGDVEESQRKETRVELLTRGGEERIYYMHTSLRPVYTAMVRVAGDSSAKIQDYDEAIAEGFVCKVSLTLYSVYNPAWDIAGQAPIPGYFALRRGTRNLCRLQGNVIGKGGDMRAQRVIVSTRHVIAFTSNADDVFGVEVNKSHAREESVHSGLLEKCRELGRSWSNGYYNAHIKLARDAIPAEGQFALRLRRAVATLKRLAEAHGVAYLDDFDNLTDDYNELDHRDDEQV